ncbi:MAG: hypothetical protein Fur0037_14110 [Planctomycetota bacterium]
MNPVHGQHGVIRRDAIRRSSHPAMIDCGSSGGEGKGPIAVVPLVEGDRVAGFEIRCGCGAATFVECVYSPEEEEHA